MRKVRIVKARSVADYLRKYYKKDRMTTTLQASYEEKLKKWGFVCTGHYDNVTGEFIAWPHYPERRC
jgi:hypothetical protein